MTDNEIIKALKCCLNVDSKCADCHFLFEKHFCKNALLKQTLDLINRQQQENRQLHVKLDDCERDIIPKLKYSLERANKYGAETDAENIRLLEENEKLKAEIERLKGNAPKFFISDKTPSSYFKVKSQHPCLIYPKDEITIELVPSEEQIKSEAIKDFAERLKERTISYVGVVEQQEAIDNLAKEMTGEQQ